MSNERGWAEDLARINLAGAAKILAPIARRKRFFNRARGGCSLGHGSFRAQRSQHEGRKAPDRCVRQGHGPPFPRSRPPASPAGDGLARCCRLALRTHADVQRKSSSRVHGWCSSTASLRATATHAFFRSARAGRKGGGERCQNLFVRQGRNGGRAAAAGGLIKFL